MKKIKYGTLLVGLLLAACDNQPVTVTVTPETQHVYPAGAVSAEPVVSHRPPDSAYRNPGDPNRLLDTSSEVVNFALGSRHALQELTRLVRDDPPTRAELNCSLRESWCKDAASMFNRQHIPVRTLGEGRDVALIYERLVTRDCDSRFIDNSKNPYNLYHSAFGCSMVANTVQMVSDKRQLTDPSLMDLQDGEKAVQSYRRYKQPPPPVTKPSESFLKTIRTD